MSETFRTHIERQPLLTNMSCPEADGDLTCQSGARWEDINQALRDKGIPLFFPVSLTARARHAEFTDNFVLA